MAQGLGGISGKGNQYAPRWDMIIKDLKIDLRKGAVTVRLVGLTSMGTQHWFNDRKGGNRPPKLCTKRDHKNNMFGLANKCPAHDDFYDRGQEFLLMNCIDRELQKQGDPNGGLRVIELPTDINEYLVNVKKGVKMSSDRDVTDPVWGVDLIISKMSNNKLSINGVGESGRSPLQDFENPYLPDGSPNPNCTIPYFDLDSILPDFTNRGTAEQFARDMKDLMVQSGYYVKQIPGPLNERDPWSSVQPDADGVPFIKYRALCDFDLPLNIKGRSGLCKFAIKGLNAGKIEELQLQPFVQPNGGSLFSDPQDGGFNPGAMFDDSEEMAAPVAEPEPEPAPVQKPAPRPVVQQTRPVASAPPVQPKPAVQQPRPAAAVTPPVQPPKQAPIVSRPPTVTPAAPAPDDDDPFGDLDAAPQPKPVAKPIARPAPAAKPGAAPKKAQPIVHPDPAVPAVQHPEHGWIPACFIGLDGSIGFDGSQRKCMKCPKSVECQDGSVQPDADL